MQHDTGGHEVHLDFTREFRAINPARQSGVLQTCIKNLINDISQLDQNYRDMLAILQTAKAAATCPD